MGSRYQLKVSTDDNPADLGTKVLSKEKMNKHLTRLGYVGDSITSCDENDAEVLAITVEQEDSGYCELDALVVLHAAGHPVTVGVANHQGAA